MQLYISSLQAFLLDFEIWVSISLGFGTLDQMVSLGLERTYLLHIYNSHIEILSGLWNQFIASHSPQNPYCFTHLLYTGHKLT